MLLANAAKAQIAANVSLATRDIFRGESTSGGDAAASLEISYDHPGGIFAGTSVTVSGGEHKPHINGSTQYVGYALRTGETTLELGLIHRDYDGDSLFDNAYSPHYFEGFAGVTRRSFRLRLYVSPDYLRDGRTSYYGEVDDRFIKTGRLLLNGHAGVTVLPPDVGDSETRFYYDWSLSVVRPLGKFTLSLGVAATNYPVFAPDQGPKLFQNKPSVFASINRSF